jgi:hypothetical protein
LGHPGDFDFDIVQEGRMRVWRPELQSLKHPLLPATESHPPIGQCLSLVSENVFSECRDVNSERVGEGDHAAVKDLGMGTHGSRRVGVSAGEMLDPEGTEYLISRRGLELGANAAGIGFRPEQHDVQQVVQPVDRVGHEQSILRVERAGRL